MPSCFFSGKKINAHSVGALDEGFLILKALKVPKVLKVLKDLKDLKKNHKTFCRKKRKISDSTKHYHSIICTSN